MMHHPYMKTVAVVFCMATLVFPCAAGHTDTTREADKIVSIINEQCYHLDRDKLRDLLLARFSVDIHIGITQELLGIMEGVIKRADFDGISEDKTVEIIGLAYEAYQKGAPLEYVDQLFDITYAKPMTSDSLSAAAKVLREFHNSDVPQEIAEEFVYHALEDGWDPATLTVLARGLIYGVERGLTPQKVALVILLDVRNGALKTEDADQLVLKALELVRQREPKNWKPLNKAEKDAATNRGKINKLDALQREAEAKKRQIEIEKKKSEEIVAKLRSDGESTARVAEQERITEQLDATVRAYQADILDYQAERKTLDNALLTYQSEMDKEKIQISRERDESRRRQLDDMGRSIKTLGKSGSLDIMKLYASVDRYMGVPYRYGGDSEYGLDCSAFTRRVYREQNVELPRSSWQQTFVGFRIGGASLKLGDLVFFDTSITGNVSHVGIYLGNGIFAHSSSSTGVTKSSLRERYYSKRFVTANRIFEL